MIIGRLSFITANKARERRSRAGEPRTAGRASTQWMSLSLGSCVSMHEHFSFTEPNCTIGTEQEWLCQHHRYAILYSTALKPEQILSIPLCSWSYGLLHNLTPSDRISGLTCRLSVVGGMTLPVPAALRPWMTSVDCLTSLINWCVIARTQCSSSVVFSMVLEAMGSCASLTED